MCKAVAEIPRRTIHSISFTTAFINHLQRNERYDNVKILISPEMGGKYRVDGANKYVSKLHSVTLPTNDATQTTAGSQPILTDAVPSEKYALMVPVLLGKSLNHPAIKFEANEAWSYTLVVNNFGIPSTYISAYVFNNATANYYNKLNRIYK